MYDNINQVQMQSYQFAQCSGTDSVTVCIALLNSDDVPTMTSISISQILVLPDITGVIVLDRHFLVFSLPTSVPTLYHGFTHA